MTTTTIRVTQTREALAAVAYQLGFQPTDSLVVVSLRGPRKRIGLVARVDLLDADTAAPALAAHLVADGASAALVIAYTDNLDHAHDGALFVDDALHAAGIGTVGVWWVTATDYRVINPQRPNACPATGQALDLDSTVIAATMVSHGVTAHRTRADLAITPAHAHARTEAVDAARQWSGGTSEHRQAGLALWRAALTGSDRTPPRAGHLAAALGDVLVRDAVLCTMLPGGDQAADAVLTSPGTNADIVSTTLAQVFDPTAGVEPDPTTTGPARDLLAHIAAHTDSAPALTLLAFLAWWHGNGAQANIHLDHAQAIDPDYRLALLLRHAMDAGLPPGWARTRR